MGTGHCPARVDREGDREPPEKSCAQQSGFEAVPTGARDRKGDKAVAEENQNECSQHFCQVFLSPAFGYRHLLPPPRFDQMSRDDACTMVPVLAPFAPPLAGVPN